MEILVEVTSRVNENEQILDIMEIHARKLLNWRRKEGDRIVDEKYVGDDKIVVREFVVELDPYTDKDIAEFEFDGFEGNLKENLDVCQEIIKEHKILNTPRKWHNFNNKGRGVL